MAGTIPQEIQRIEDEVATQAAKIAQLSTILDGKAAGGGGGGVETCTVTVTKNAQHYCKEIGALTHDGSTYSGICYTSFQYGVQMELPITNAVCKSLIYIAIQDTETSAPVYSDTVTQVYTKSSVSAGTVIYYFIATGNGTITIG